MRDEHLNVQVHDQLVVRDDDHLLGPGRVVVGDGDRWVERRVGRVDVLAGLEVVVNPRVVVGHRVARLVHGGYRERVQGAFGESRQLDGVRGRETVHGRGQIRRPVPVGHEAVGRFVGLPGDRGAEAGNLTRLHVGDHGRHTVHVGRALDHHVRASLAVVRIDVSRGDDVDHGYLQHARRIHQVQRDRTPEIGRLGGHFRQYNGLSAGLRRGSDGHDDGVDDRVAEVQIAVHHPDRNLVTAGVQRAIELQPALRAAIGQVAPADDQRKVRVQRGSLGMAVLVDLAGDDLDHPDAGFGVLDEDVLDRVDGVCLAAGNGPVAFQQSVVPPVDHRGW